MSIIKHVTLQKIVAHDFRYHPRISLCLMWCQVKKVNQEHGLIMKCIDQDVSVTEILHVFFDIALNKQILCPPECQRC